MSAEAFDPAAKERELRAAADSWDVSDVVPAHDGDVPVVDVGPYFASGDDADLAVAADVLRTALETVGFHQLVGHGITPVQRAAIFEQTERFHALDEDVRRRIEMDRPGWPVGGVGYLPPGERKLPRRAQGNANEAFLMKSDIDIAPDDNQWLTEDVLPGFRAQVETYADLMEHLALRLLPVYAAALDLPAEHFTPGFASPFWRLRLTHYPPAEPRRPGDPFGIAPHVDTTFITLLLPGGPGLTIYSHRRDRWITVPVIDGAYVVNAGELLRQWSNDRVLSTRHFAHNPDPNSRYSIPFFFNATSDYRMECLPSCHSPDNPPKYPPFSYRESQAAVQGE
ncbi:MAG: 2OG-Fe(II) oxygenase family protein [Actinomycetota bacterium]